MNELGGLLSITQLENVSNIDEVRSASLSKKFRIHSLKLEWSYSAKNGLHSEEVLDGLAPPREIKDLEIIGYDGIKSPSWLEANADSIRYLEKISLIGCKKWKSLPPPLGEFRILKVLNLEGLTSIIKIGLELCCQKNYSLISFTLLEELCFVNLPNWEVWEEHEQSFPCLRQLVIRDCPNLRQLPNLYTPVLEAMHTESVGLKFLHLPKLKLGEESILSHIRVVGCRDLCCWFLNCVHSHMLLRELIVESCPRFSSFVISGNQEGHAPLPSPFLIWK